MTLDFATVLERWPMFVDGAWMTVRLATGATLTGFVIGTFCAIARRSSRGWARHASTAYVEMIRNTPLLVQIFLVYFGLEGRLEGQVGVALPARLWNGADSHVARDSNRRPQRQRSSSFPRSPMIHEPLAGLRRTR